VLQSPNREDAHRAIALLEAAGPEAHAATEAIILALVHRDQEIRYLAARSLAKLADNSPAAMKALQGVTDDPNGMVRKVARKAIAAQAPTLSPRPQD
jgi:vesicle coat complex subunit